MAEQVTQLTREETLLIQNFELRRKLAQLEMDGIDREQQSVIHMVQARTGVNLRDCRVDLSTGICSVIPKLQSVAQDAQPADSDAANS